MSPPRLPLVRLPPHSTAPYPSHLPAPPRYSFPTAPSRPPLPRTPSSPQSAVSPGAASPASHPCQRLLRTRYLIPLLLLLSLVTLVLAVIGIVSLTKPSAAKEGAVGEQGYEATVPATRTSTRWQSETVGAVQVVWVVTKTEVRGAEVTAEGERGQGGVGGENGEGPGRWTETFVVRTRSRKVQPTEGV